MCKTTIILAVSMVASASAFHLGAPSAAPMALRQPALCSARHSQFNGVPAMRQAPAVRARSSTELKMSLFGLGVPELAVIGVLAALIFGPKNLAGMGKDLGKIAGSLKAEAQTFSSAMQDSLDEAETGMKEPEKEVAKPVTAAKPTESAAAAAPAPAAAKPAAKKIDLTDE
mmetsp:Transcript_16156/g.23763  ORF Transcript_16156/g.23763 Transcript_16156/m.23763 type:complete len:171 (-) Transcript_16156:140-652(-)|eukprot:CAMPEP_0179440974 /NCGR_PEP_ID=MMETSP0799-20121207/24584_1 /TAXON_ID=46947 /ORGANISM="Geminigera cryophila, Strain CCMP2564" /LENGTH=170 /DNA_ID=CAMNT_0021224881 /DNA_START=46 /DNA_END=558 /DNA_ORIENTATION=+